MKVVYIVRFLLVYATSIVYAKEYLITLKENVTIQKFLCTTMDQSLSMKQFLTNKVTKTFTIGALKGFSMDLSHDLLQVVKSSSFVSEIIPNFKVRVMDSNENENNNKDMNQDQGNYLDDGENMYDDQENFPNVVIRQEGAPRHLARLSRRFQLPFDFNNIELYKRAFNYYYDKLNQGDDVRAYIIDTGIYREHQDFENRVEFGINLTEENIGDFNGHGTHVAGIVGSKTFGVAKNVTMVDVKCLDGHGQGSLISVLSGLEFAINDCNMFPDKKCVANLSLGSVKTSVLNQAISEATKNGVIVVVAAGNYNMNACWVSPASSLEAITVGAFDDRIDTIAKFSNWGSCVDIFAPGVSVASLANKDEPRYIAYSGTSMASPSVCGLVALLLNEGIEPNEIKKELIDRSTEGVFNRRTLIFKPQTPNKIAYNGVDREDDMYEGLKYPKFDINSILKDLDTYSRNFGFTSRRLRKIISRKNKNHKNIILNIDNDVSLPPVGLHIQ